MIEPLLDQWESEAVNRGGVVSVDDTADFESWCEGYQEGLADGHRECARDLKKAFAAEAGSGPGMLPEGTEKEQNDDS